MQKTLYFKSSNQRHFIEVINDTDIIKTYRVYFPFGNTNLFKIENSKISDFPDFDNGYNITVDIYSSAFLEISPRCVDVNVDAAVACVIESEDNTIYDTYTLAISIRKGEYKKGLSDYITLDKKFSNFEKEINDTFLINSIYPKLTGNIKFRIDSNGKLYLSLMENVKDRYNKNLFNKKIKLGSNLLNELKNISDELLDQKESFYEYIANENFVIDSTTPYNTQNLDDIYNAGVTVFPSKFYKEQLAITAPLYLGKSIPKYFVIFKKENYKDISKNSFYKDLKIVKTFDLSKNTEVGLFIENTKNSINYDNEHIELEWRNSNPILQINGIDIRQGTISTKYENIYDYINSEERTVSEFEKYVTDAYIRNNMVSHKIFNFEFLFDDDSSDFASYFGMYCDDLEIDKFDVDLLEYNNTAKLNAIQGVSTPILQLHTNSTKTIDNKYVNDGNRVFFLKDPSGNFHYLKNVISEKNKNIFETEDLDLSNFVCKSNTHIINQNTDIVDFKPYNEFYFISNFNINDRVEIHEINKKFIFRFEQEEPFLIYENITTIPQDSGIISSELSSNEKSIIINDIKDFSQGDNIIFINSDDSEISTTIVDVTYNGEQTIIKVPDSINIDDVEYVKYDIDEHDIIDVLIGETIEQSLSRLVNAINKLESVPFNATVNGTTIRIESNRNVQFDVYLNFSNTISSLLSVQHFGQDIIPIFETSNSKEFEISRMQFTSPYPLFQGEKMVKLPIDSFIGTSNKLFIDNGNINNTISNGLKHTNIKQDDNYLFRINDSSINSNLELFEVCKTSVGLFSFYEVKDYDFARLTTDQNYYTSEYNLIYKKYNPLEILQPAQYYRIKNTGTIDLSITIMYSLNDSLNTIDLNTIIIAPDSEKYFSTFLSDYGLESYKDTIQFKYRYNSGDSFKVTPYFIKLDGILNNFVPTYPTNALNVLGLKNISDTLAKDGDPDYIKLYNSKSEYTRLQENKIINNDLTDFIKPSFLKWESPEYIDAKGDWLRLSFSKAFGKTGHAVHYSNFEVNTEAHSHEWFMLDEVPTGLNVYEKSQQIYGFDKIDRSLLLDTTSNYFNEYFNSGYPNIKRNTKNLSFSRKQNYSKIQKIANDEYETFYKGVKYRFTGQKDLTDYKFSVVASTRPGNTELSSAFETHCISDTLDYSCNIQGILPELNNAISTMVSGDQTLNLNVSIVQQGVPAHLDGKFIGTTLPFELIEFTEAQTFNVLNEAFLEWTNLLTTAYSKENGMDYDLTLNYNIDYENIPYPIIQTPLPEEIKELAGLGNIRVAIVDGVGMTEKAKTFFVTQQQFDDDFEYLIPTIVINYQAFFRDDSISPANGAYSLLYVLVHEIGHALGLGHTLKEDSVMNPNIKISDNYRDKFPNGLNYYIDGKCVLEAYGNPTDTTPVSELFSCDSNPKIAKDNYEILINDKYKTITVKIDVDLDSYLTLDSKKSYLDIYLTQDFKRITLLSDNNFVPRLEPSDIQVPMINLSYKAIDFKNDNIRAPYINNYISELNSFNLGISPEKSFFRLRNTNNSSKNYQFNRFMLNSSNDNYFLNESYDAESQINKTAISTINNNSNTAVTINYPLNDLQYYKDSTFWRILGGGAINNANYKLTLDFFASILQKIPHVTANNNGSISNTNDFSLSIIPPSKIDIKMSKYLEGTLNNFEIKNSRGTSSIFRHSAKFNPKYDEIIFFGLRDDLDFSISLGIDFFKCNTRILHENPNFGKIIKLRKKVSDVPIYKEDTIYNLGSSNSPLFEESYNVLKTIADSDYFKVFNNETSYTNKSGLSNLKSFKNFNSLIFPRFDYIEFIVTPDLLDFNKIQNTLEGSIDYEAAIRNALISIYEDSYSKIYSKDNLDFNKSLLNFIENSILLNYTLNELQYFEKYTPSNTSYTINPDGLTKINSLNSYFQNDKIKFNKTVSYNVEFSIKIIFKFI